MRNAQDARATPRVPPSRGGWVGGDGCMVRLVAIVDPIGSYRLETGNAA